jgi:hypothetical protein
LSERFAVIVSVNRRTNHNPVQLLDIARRQSDYLGRRGIEAKRGQKDRVLIRKGLLRLEYGDRETARAYQDRVEALGYSELETKRLRIGPKVENAKPKHPPTRRR